MRSFEERKEEIFRRSRKRIRARRRRILVLGMCVILLIVTPFAWQRLDRSNNQLKQTPETLEQNTPPEQEHSSELLTFSFAADHASLSPTAVVKQSEFINNTPSPAGTVNEAIRCAAAECTMENWTAQPAYDPDTKLWRIRFCDAAQPDKIQTVYLNQNGITQLIVFTE